MVVLSPTSRGNERNGRAWIVAALVALALPMAALAAPVSVTVQDKGVKTLCAEEDNVYATLTAPGVRGFEAVARQPAYGAAIKRDVYKPDFRHCAITASHDFKFTPRQVTLYDDAKVKVRGIAYPSYWRPDLVAVDVAGRKDQGLHLLQIFVKDHGRWQEALVLHLADGYWRLRPLPLPQLKVAVYGSSFLVGPVEEAGRPFVRIQKVLVDPKALSLRVMFAAGGQAEAQIVRLDRRELRLKVALDPAVKGGPFVALRSMDVAPDNADTAELRWSDGAGSHTAGAVGFGRVEARSLAFARSVPSRHNTSAPDIAFEGFEN